MSAADNLEIPNVSDTSSDTNVSHDAAVVPDEFISTMNEFTHALMGTFPEYTQIIHTYWPNNTTDRSAMFSYCVGVYPKRAFDILYRNADIFSNNSIDTCFLPEIDFKSIWNENISNNTKDAIWKYLNLILVITLGQVQSPTDFADAEHMFEWISKGELQTKLEEVFSQFSDMNAASAAATSTPCTESCGIHSTNEQSSDEDSDYEFVNDGQSTGAAASSQTSLPNVEELMQHINEMMNGKIGKLATELATEAADKLGIDIQSEVTDGGKSLFGKLFSNKAQLMDLVKSIGDKIKTKIDSGELKESELMKEGMELMEKMKNIPGMKDIMKNMNMANIPGMGGKGGKVNLGAMKGNLERNMRLVKIRERLREKAAQKSLNKKVNEIVTDQQIQEQRRHEAELLQMIELEQQNNTSNKPHANKTANKNKHGRKKNTKK